MKKRSRVISGIAAAAAIVLTGCSVATQAGEQGVLVEDYVMINTAPEVIECMKPESQDFYHSKKLYKYPSRNISWDATGQQGSERGPYKVVSSIEAPQDLSVPVVITMKLTDDCDKLKEFHRNFGTKYQGWLNEDGSVSDGWIELLNYVVGQPTEQTLISIAQKYSWREIWNNEKVRAEFQAALQNGLQQASAKRTNNSEYFIGFDVMVLKPEPMNEGLKKAIDAEQTAVQEANALRAKMVGEADAALQAAEKEVDTAIAQTRVAEEQALRRKAEIAGFPSVEDYLKDQAIKAGLNPWQPVIVPQP